MKATAVALVVVLFFGLAGIQGIAAGAAGWSCYPPACDPEAAQPFYYYPPPGWAVDYVVLAFQGETLRIHQDGLVYGWSVSNMKPVYYPNKPVVLARSSRIARELLGVEFVLEALPTPAPDPATWNQTFIPVINIP